MSDFADAMIDAGRAIGQAGLDVTNRDVFPWDSRITLSEKLNERSEAAAEFLLCSAGGSGVAAIAIDAGCIKGHPFLTTLLVSALSGEAAVLLRLERGYGGTGEDYKRSISWAIRKALDPNGANCDIAGAVCDTLSAQDAGILGCITRDPMAAGLQKVPCGAHGFMLGIGGACRESDDCRGVVEFL
jgi:hypothetical protein